MFGPANLPEMLPLRGAVSVSALLTGIVLGAGLIALLAYGVKRLRRKMQGASASWAQMLRLFSLARAADFADEPQGPRSLNNMERVFAPKIAKDFPDLRLEALAHRAENLLMKSYEALRRGGVPADLYEDAGKIYAENLEKLIARNRELGGLAPQFSAVKIHKKALSLYDYLDGRRTIEFQFAVEAKMNNRAGDQETLKQMRDAVRFLYLEDEKKFSELAEESGVLTRNCPNCGAPLKGRSEELCPYCGSTVKSMELEVWLPSELIPDLWLKPYDPKGEKKKMNWFSAE